MILCTANFNQSKVVIFCDNASVCTGCACITLSKARDKMAISLNCFWFVSNASHLETRTGFQAAHTLTRSLTSWLKNGSFFTCLADWLDVFFGELLNMITIKHDILRAVYCCCCSFFHSLSFSLHHHLPSVSRRNFDIRFFFKSYTMFTIQHVVRTCVSVCASFYGKMCQKMCAFEWKNKIIISNRSVFVANRCENKTKWNV